MRLDPLIAFIEERAGWTLARGGTREALERFVARRSAELGMPSAEEYGARVMIDACELERLLNEVTVTHSWLFRDAHQFAIIERWMIERGRESLNVWVPGCASGEDAYTLAMLGRSAGLTLEVLGSDINAIALSAARRARYDAWSSRDVPPRYRGFLLPRADGTFEISGDARSHVRFENHNLIAPVILPKSAGKWDLIVCRNVLIYFSRPKALRVLETLAHAIAPDGCLILGASDLVQEVPTDLVPTYVDERLLLMRRRRTRPPPKRGSVPRLSASQSESMKSRTSLRLDPAASPAALDRAEELLKRGLEELQQGRLKASFEAFRSVCERDPLRSEAHLYLGIAHHLAGDSEQAMTALRAALLLNPALWPASYYLALCFENLGHWREARREFERVLEAEAAPVPELGMAELDLWRGDLVSLARRRLRKGAR